VKYLGLEEGVEHHHRPALLSRQPGDRGTAFDVAGQGIADPRSMSAAIEHAADRLSPSPGARPARTRRIADWRGEPHTRPARPSGSQPLLQTRLHRRQLGRQVMPGASRTVRREELEFLGPGALVDRGLVVA
jgi:hypothetical protein